jgi:uncharacterized membrane-anchored protein YhcB (DUF1043 family)
MGWSYRKSFGSGPFRINLSKSGVSFSAGVKGARVNIGPRGTYVNLSSHGISYRHKISGGQLRPQPHYEGAIVPAVMETGNIASAAILQLTDSDSKAFITELTSKAGLVRYARWFGTFPLIIFMLVLLFTSFGSKTVLVHPVTDSVLAAVSPGAGVNIRKAANGRSAILKAAPAGQTFLLLDSANQKWLEVGLHDSVGYISRRFAAIKHVHHDAVTEEQAFLANPYAGYILLAGIAGFIVLIRWLRKKDRERFQTELHYEMTEQFQEIYRQFGDHFTAFSRSARIWQYLNASRTSDFKHNAGAGKLIKRTAVGDVSVNRLPIPYLITNVSIPYLKLNNIEFYFLPERLLIKRGGAFAAVFYKNLHISISTTQFIESEPLPCDAKVVDHTWQYVNKSGGPDRRFSSNRQIPVCMYSEYTLTSDTGIYEVIATSKPGAMDAFANFLTQIGVLQSGMAVN